MKILALEFSSIHRSVALVDGNLPAPSRPDVSKPLPIPAQSQLRILACAEASGPKSGHALQLIDRALSEANLSKGDIEALAVSIGPGSYTGIRTAIALAQGWSLTGRVRVTGVPTFDSLALQVQSLASTETVTLVADAQRNEFYSATYSLTSVGVELLRPLRLLSTAELEQRLEAGEVVFGPDLADRFTAIRPVQPSAACVGRLALLRPQFTPAETLEPIYLRPTVFLKAPPPRIVE